MQVQPYLLFDGPCEEEVEWGERCPASDSDVIEIRQVFEMADFPPRPPEGRGQPHHQGADREAQGLLTSSPMSFLWLNKKNVDQSKKFERILYAKNHPMFVVR